MASKPKTFKYEHEDPRPLTKEDLYRLFNNYRIQKYVIELLCEIGKTDFPNYKVLEPGCGDGSKLRFFAEHRIPPENCYGLEISEVAVDICKRWSPAGMNFEVGSVLDMDYEDDTFDLIMCSGLFDYFNEDEEVIQASKELGRVMKPDGVMFVLDINENYNQFYGGNPHMMAKNLRPFDSTNGELENLLQNEFTIVSRVPAFCVERYSKPSGQPGEMAGVTDLPLLDMGMDLGNIPCVYTLWTFFANFEQSEP